MSGGRAFTRIVHTYSAGELGLSAQAVVAGSPVTSNNFSIAGCNQIAVWVAHTHSAASAILWDLDFKHNRASTGWFERTSSGVSSGTETVSNNTMTYTTGGASSNYLWLAACYGDGVARLVFDSTAGDAGDLLTVFVEAGVST